MLFHEKNKCVDRDLDLVLVCSHDMANMDAKEQADRMAAAEALYMISTRGNKGRGDTTIPRKSKRGRKAKKPKTDFEESEFVKSNEIQSSYGEGCDDSLINNNVKRQGGHEGESRPTFTKPKQSFTKRRGRGAGLTRSSGVKSDRSERVAGNFNKQEPKDVKSGLTPISMQISDVAENLDLETKKGRRYGKKGRGRGIVSIGQDEPISHSTSSYGSFIFSEPKQKRQNKIKSPKVGDGDDLSSSKVRSRSLSEDKTASENILDSMTLPKKHGRFREKSPRSSKNSDERESDDDTKTEIQAIGFTGAAVTLIKTVPRGPRPISSQRRTLVLSNESSNKTQQAGLLSPSVSSTGTGLSSSITGPPSLPSLTSEVLNLPSIPVGIESLQLSSVPMPNLSSLSGLNKESKQDGETQNERDKAQKVLPLKKRKLHSQKQEKQKVLEDGSDVESEEVCSEQGNSPSTNSLPQVQAKFTVQAHPIITMQTLMEINTALTPDEDGDLPLHIAVVHENMRMVTKLINLMKIAVKGVDKFNKQQQTPLHLAVKLNFLPAVALLISSGACVNTVDGSGSSAIHMAVQGRFCKCLEHMLRSCQDAEVNARNFEGLTPLHLAVNNKDLDQVRLLLKYGAEVDLADGKSGRTALFHAAETNQKPMVELLLKQGANPELPNYAGVTTTMAAQGRSLHSILKLIGSVTQEIKWSFVAMKSNSETQPESDHQSAKPSFPSVQVYGGKSLLGSEPFKPNSHPLSDGTDEKSKVYHNMLVVKGINEENVKKSLTAKHQYSHHSSSDAKVKKEVDTSKGEDFKSKVNLTSSDPSLHRVKQEVVDDMEVSTFFRTNDGKYIPLNKREQQDGDGRRGQPSMSDGKAASPSLLSRRVDEKKQESSTVTHLQPPQPALNKNVSSPSACPSSPRTPISSTADSVTLTSMQARLYKKLLEMYNIDTSLSQWRLNSPGLTSLPAFPTQSSCSSSPNSPKSAIQGKTKVPSASSQPTSPLRNNPSALLLQRSFSNHSESEQQTYLVRRNPVQRISVLPTPRDSLTSRSDSPSFYSQSSSGRNTSHVIGSETQLRTDGSSDPDVPLNLSSKTSRTLSSSSASSLHTSAHALIKPSQTPNAPLDLKTANTPLDLKKMFGEASLNNDASVSNSKIPPLIHHSQLGTNFQGRSISPKNGERSESYPKSAVYNQEKQMAKTGSDCAQGGQRLIVTDLPHLTKSVSSKTASLVRTFLANHSTSVDTQPVSRIPESSAFSISSSLSSSKVPITPCPNELPVLNISTASSISSASPNLDYTKTEHVTANPSQMPSEAARTVISSDPTFLHQGRIIDLSQGEEIGKGKSAHVSHPPTGKIVGFSGAILSLSPSDKNDPPEDKRSDKSISKDTYTKVSKKRGRRGGKPSQGFSDPLEVTPNKIKYETDRKLKRYLGLKQTDSAPPGNYGSTDGSTIDDPKMNIDKKEISSSPVIETVGIFSGNIQHVMVGKSPSISPSAKTFSSSPTAKPLYQPYVGSGTSLLSPSVPLSSQTQPLETREDTNQSDKSHVHSVANYQYTMIPFSFSGTTSNNDGSEHHTSQPDKCTNFSTQEEEGYSKSLTEDEDFAMNLSSSPNALPSAKAKNSKTSILSFPSSPSQNSVNQSAPEANLESSKNTVGKGLHQDWTKKFNEMDAKDNHQRDSHSPSKLSDHNDAKDAESSSQNFSMSFSSNEISCVTNICEDVCNESNSSGNPKGSGQRAPTPLHVENVGEISPQGDNHNKNLGEEKDSLNEDENSALVIDLGPGDG